MSIPLPMADDFLAGLDQLAGFDWQAMHEQLLLLLLSSLLYVSRTPALFLRHLQ